MYIETKNLIVLLLYIVIFSLSGNFCSAGDAPLQDIHCTGKVMDYEANPVTQADVYLFEIHYAYAEGRIIYKPLGQTVTDSQGNYVLDVQAVRSDNILIVAYKSGLALSYEKVANPGTHLEFLIRLGKTDIFSGTVLNQDKEPIANAMLQVRLKSETDRGSGISIPSLEKLFITTTDAQGHFSFSHVPEGSSADFFVEAPGKAATWTFWEDTNSQFPAGREDIEIVLKDESRIEGRVIDEDTGQGVPGVTLLARSDRGMDNYYCYFRTVSNQEGHFELAGLQSDNYSIQVVAKYEEMPDWVGKDVKVAIEPGQTKQNIEIPVSKGSIIEITLISESTGEPLESALANVSQTANFGRHPCYYKSNYSEENGVAIFRVPQGECRVYAGGNRYVYFQDPEPINAVKGQVHKREIVLVDKPSVSGIVTDQNGEPVENVLVTSKPVCDQSDMTDSQGRFEVKWYLAPIYSSRKWLLLAQDFENCRAGLVEITEETETQNITLRPAYTLSGQVTDPNGIGIPMASVKLMGRLPGWITNIGNKVLADKQGWYEIKAIPAQIPDLTLRLEIAANSYSFVSDIDARPEGDPNIPIEISPVTLQPKDQTLSGIVVDANEEPVVGIDVILSSGVIGEPIISTVTDNQGRFFFDRVKRGSLRIQAGMGGGPVDLGFMEAQGGDKDIKVILGQRLVHIPSQSLINKPLPDLSELGTELVDSANKSILLCFFDYQQRPSRNAVLQLVQQAEELQAKDIAVVLLQASSIDQATLDEWIEENEIAFLAGMIVENEEETRFNWGVKSLPWLILTDGEHIVTAEGFSIAEIDTKIEEKRKKQ